MTDDDAGRSSPDAPGRSLHHDLRDSLSAVQMNLQTLEALEAGEADVAAEKRIAIVRRAKAALREAVEVADRMRGNADGISE